MYLAIQNIINSIFNISKYVLLNITKVWLKSLSDLHFETYYNGDPEGFSKEILKLILIIIHIDYRKNYRKNAKGAGRFGWPVNLTYLKNY